MCVCNLLVVSDFLVMKAEHTVASYNGRDFTSKIAAVQERVSRRSSGSNCKKWWQKFSSNFKVEKNMFLTKFDKKLLLIFR
jgi:hypothetical protein